MSQGRCVSLRPVPPGVRVRRVSGVSASSSASDHPRACTCVLCLLLSSSLLLLSLCRLSRLLSRSCSCSCSLALVFVLDILPPLLPLLPPGAVVPALVLTLALLACITTHAFLFSCFYFGSRAASGGDAYSNRSGAGGGGKCPSRCAQKAKGGLYEPRQGAPAGDRIACPGHRRSRTGVVGR